MQPRSWILAASCLAAVLLAMFVAYQETAASFVHVWIHSETFAHGFLIAPISGFLVWQNRRSLAFLTPRPFAVALLLLPPLGLAWLAGRATSTLLVEQFTFVAFIPVLVLALFGPRITRRIAFPLGFLIFAVPFGDILQPVLMDITAAFAVGVLRLAGVPVVREGVLFTTTVADWRVAEACSGLRYLVAGIALTTLFAHETYQKIWKRVTCVVLALAVLILANGFRACVIVLAGYLSDMRLGRGFAHYAFGWVVYIVAMIAFFAVGSRFRDLVPAANAGPAPDGRGETKTRTARVGAWIAVAGMAAVAACCWPAIFALLMRPVPGVHANPISAPVSRGGWVVEPEGPLAWEPALTGETSIIARAYTKGGATVQCNLAYYDQEHDERELIQHRNVVVRQDDLTWRNLGERDRRIETPHGSLVVRETDIRGPNGPFVVWHWYWIPDEFTTSRAWAKLLQARASLILKRDHAAAIILSSQAADMPAAVSQLTRFTEAMLPSIHAALLQAEIRARAP